MAQLLGQVNPGTIVKLNESGSPVEFYVAAQDYESGLNGQGRVLLVRKDVYDNRAWSSNNVNAYASSYLDNWFNSTYKNMLDADTRSLIGTTKIRYTPGNGNWTVGTLERAIFALSLTELGQSSTHANTEGSALPIASTLQVAHLNGNATNQWTRSPSVSDTRDAVFLYSGGQVGAVRCYNSYGSRPVFTLPATLLAQSDGTITTSPDLSIYVPSLAMQGQSLPIQWSPISNATSYQLQRNTGSTWETIYTGTDTSYTDTVGSWTTVQYQVAVDIGGGYGAYTQSASIPVIPASTLVISGQDGSLGTITADIPYTVTSDTGNTISLVRTVNGVQYGARTVESGFAYNIPVMELPTGNGTIVITASVQSSSGLVTVTRTWTYTKTPINFSNSGSVASLSVNGENILPTTLAEAVRTSPVWGGSLDLALQILSQATLYKTVTPTEQLGTLPEGSIIYLNESGSPVPFYVAKQGYEPGYNTNRVLVVRKDVAQPGAWNSSGVNTYNGSTIDTWFNQTYLQTLDSNVQTAIATTNIPYTPMGGTTTVQRISKAVFALSGTECGATSQNANIEGTQLSLGNLFNIPQQWTRSPSTASSTASFVTTSGVFLSDYQTNNTSYYYRPAFTLPSSFMGYMTAASPGLYDLSDNLILTLPGTQIETGSYVGTGTYGSANMNSLTFGFEPKIWGIYAYNTNSTAQSSTEAVNSWAFPWGVRFLIHGAGPNSSAGYSITASYQNNTVSWYSSNASGQYNDTSFTYYYIALG